MNKRSLLSVAAIAVSLLWISATQAEVTDIAGYARAEVTQLMAGSTADTDHATDSFPDTAAELPLQVIATLINTSDNISGAAAAAAQFADPRTLTQSNPEEFAANLSLYSADADVSYTGNTLLRETRDITFQVGEIAASEDGEPISVTGRLYIDGALTLFALDPSQDLTGATVELAITVVQRAEGSSDQTVFNGTLELRGDLDGDADVLAGGDFPTSRLIHTDLSIISADFAAFHVLIIPGIQIDYTYQAEVEQPFTLEATIEIDAANIAGDVGVAAVLGTPADTLAQVIDVTQGEVVAGEFVSAIESERDEPTGELAFPQQVTSFPLLPSCGLLGFESFLALAGLAGLCGMRRRV